MEEVDIATVAPSKKGALINLNLINGSFFAPVKAIIFQKSILSQLGSGNAKHAWEDQWRRHVSQALNGEEGRLKGIRPPWPSALTTSMVRPRICPA